MREHWFLISSFDFMMQKKSLVQTKKKNFFLLWFGLFQEHFFCYNVVVNVEFCELQYSNMLTVLKKMF